MTSAIFIVSFAAFLFGIQLRNSIKQKLYKGLIASAVIYSLSVFYALGEVFDWNLPTFSGLMKAVFEPFSRMIF